MRQIAVIYRSVPALNTLQFFISFSKNSRKNRQFIIFQYGRDKVYKLFIKQHL